MCIRDSFDPKMDKQESLSVGEVGYLVANIRLLVDVKVGDTITHAVTLTTKPATEMLKGFKEIQPVVFAGIFPTSSATSRTSATPWRSCG